MKYRSFLLMHIALLLLVGAPRAGAAPDRCNPQTATSAPLSLQVSLSDAPAGLTMLATTARPMLLPAGTSEPRLNGSSLAEDLTVNAPVLSYGDLRGDEAQMHAGDDSVSIVATGDNQRYRLTVQKGVLVDANREPLRLRPAFTPATPLVIKRGALLTRGDEGRWTVGANAQLAWVATSAQALQFVLRDPARLSVAATDRPGTSIELASSRVSPGASVPVQVRGPGPELREANYRLCLSNAAGKTVDIATKRLSDENDSTSLTAALPQQLIHTLSAAPTLWERLWGEPVSLRVIAWSGTQPVLELSEQVRMTRPWVGAVFGLLVLLIVYVFAALFAGTFWPLALFGRLIRHSQTGRYSLTSFQTLCWTLLVIFALCFSWYCNGVLLELRPDVLQLLGIVGGAHVLTRAVESAKSAPETTGQPAKKVDLVTNAETGEFDMLRFQMLAFTLFSLVYAAVNVWFSHGLPELPQSLYWLMGLGNAVHVAGKLPEAIGLGVKGATGTLSAFEAQLSADRIRAMQAVLAVGQTGVLDATTREALVKYMSANGLYPVGNVSEPLLRKMGVPATP